MVEFEARLVQAREAKLLDRKEKRKMDRRNAYFKEIEDRKRRDEDERRMKEEEERRKKQDEQAEKQRAREREIEEKHARRQQQEGQDQAKPAEAPSNVYRPKAAGGTGFVARVANTEKQMDNETPWRRNNAGDVDTKNVDSSSSGQDKFNYTRSSNRDEGNRDIRRDMPPSEQKSESAWRRPGGGDDRAGERRTMGEERSYGGDRGYGNRGGPGAGAGGGGGGSGMDRNNDRPSFGNRSERGGGAAGSGGVDRGGRGGGMNSRFGGDSTQNKADSSDTWRRRGDE
jgi:hypothetical protein